MSARVPNRLLALLFLPVVFGFVATVVAAWPGAISPDMESTIREAEAFTFWGHQEPMSGFVWSPVVALCSVPVSVAVFYLAQLAAFWLTFALFIKGALRERQVFAAMLGSVLGFLPPLFCFTSMIESNMQVGVAWSLAVAIASVSQSRRAQLASAFLLFYGFCARSGMIVAIPPVMFACVMLHRPEFSKRRAAMWSVVGSAGFGALAFLVTTVLLGSPSRDRVLGVSQLFDMAGVYQKTGTHLIPPALVPEGATAEEILVLYEPALCSPIFWRGDNKPVFKLPSTREEGASLGAAWLETIKRNPAAYFAVKARYAALFLMIGVEWPQGFYPDISRNAALGLGEPGGDGWTLINDYARSTATTLLWKGWFWFALTGVICFVACLLRAPRALAAAAVYAGAICNMAPQLLFGQAALVRYYFAPYILCVCSLLLLAGPLAGVIKAKLHRLRQGRVQAA
jgi:hypothetical protein